MLLTEITEDCTAAAQRFLTHCSQTCTPAHYRMNKNEVPRFKSTRLRDILRAFESRGESLRSQGGLACSRAVEKSKERLQVEFTAMEGFRVQFSAWSDGQIWIGVTHTGDERPGWWTYRDEFYRQLESLTADAVVERFVQTVKSPTEARSFWLLTNNRH